MEAGRLYESPFLDIIRQGPEGLFPAAKVDRMVQVIDEIRQRAGKRTVYRLAARGKIPAFKLGGTWRFRRAELDQWIASRIGQAADVDEEGGAA